MLILALATFCASVSICMTSLILWSAREKDRANAFDAHANEALAVAGEE